MAGFVPGASHCFRHPDNCHQCRCRLNGVSELLVPGSNQLSRQSPSVSAPLLLSASPLRWSAFSGLRRTTAHLPRYLLSCLYDYVPVAGDLVVGQPNRWNGNAHCTAHYRIVVSHRGGNTAYADLISSLSIAYPFFLIDESSRSRSALRTIVLSVY